MLKTKTWKRIAAGLMALALTAPVAAANNGTDQSGYAGIRASAEETAPDIEESDEILEGGWEFSDNSVDNVSDEQKTFLNEALDGMVGVSYEPKDVIATQLVAGTNYAYLCQATPATLSGRSYWAIVTIYVDLKKKASLTNIAKLDPTDLKVKKSSVTVPSSASGGWTVDAEESTLELPESVKEATSKLVGVSYSPIAVLGTQVVAGINYCILTYGSMAIPNAEPALYAAYVYEKLDGTAEITEIAPLDIEAYVTPEVEESLVDLADCTVEVDTEEGTVAVKNGDEEISADEYTVDYQGASNNYRGETFPKIAGSYVVTVTAKEDSTVITGTVKQEFEIAEPKEIVTGGWTFSDIAADNVTEEEQAVLDQALEGLMGVNYEAKDVIATQVVAGENLAFLCKATPTTLSPQPHWAIVTVYKDLKGNATLTNIAALDITDLKVKSGVTALEPGSWQSQVKENVPELPESVKEATSKLVGVSYSPIAVLGTQVVAGTNYCILAYGSLATADAVTSLYVANVYEKPDGTAEITEIAPLDIEAYVTPEVEESLVDLADCTVEVDTKQKTVTIKNGETELSDAEYSLEYQGVNVDYIGPEFPKDHGTYTVTATANEESDVVTGSVSKEFEIAKEQKYFAEPEELGTMSAKDYELKHQDSKVTSQSVTEAENGLLSIELKDSDGTVLDVYTIDPVTGLGEDQNGESVDLPQTGITSTAARNAGLGALLMMTTGAFAVLRSGVFRKKRKDQ